MYSITVVHDTDVDGSWLASAKLAWAMQTNKIPQSYSKRNKAVLCQMVQQDARSWGRASTRLCTQHRGFTINCLHGSEIDLVGHFWRSCTDSLFLYRALEAACAACIRISGVCGGGGLEGLSPPQTSEHLHCKNVC